jgi:hypothetical protein
VPNHNWSADNASPFVKAIVTSIMYFIGGRVSVAKLDFPKLKKNHEITNLSHIFSIELRQQYPSVVSCLLFVCTFAVG